MFRFYTNQIKDNTSDKKVFDNKTVCAVPRRSTD